METYDLLVFLVLVVLGAILGAVEWIVAVEAPGTNVVTAVTAVAVGLVGYRLGRHHP